MSAVLVTAASRYGSTAEIAHAIAATLRRRGLSADVMAPEEVEDLEGYDAVVLGSAIYAGHWLPAARDFATRHAEALSSRPVWLFSSGPVGNPARRLVQQMGIDPAALAMLEHITHARGHHTFAGRLEKARLRWPHRLASVMFNVEGDFRDWRAIERWSEQIADVLQVVGAPAGV